MKHIVALQIQLNRACWVVRKRSLFERHFCQLTAVVFLFFNSPTVSRPTAAAVPETDDRLRCSPNVCVVIK